MNLQNQQIANEPIDAVIAWVDGSDPQLAAKRNRYLGRNTNTPPGAQATRFASVNEIRYCVLAIMRFAPFIRNIYIITDGQDPNLYDDIRTYFPERLNSFRIVDHKEIFEGFENYLPTFNSISIGNMIWRIKGISNNFIYFNDDTILVRPVEPTNFFINNKPVLRGKWVPSPIFRIAWSAIRIGINKHILRNPKYQPRASFHLGQWHSAWLAGFRFRYFANSHTPHTVGREVVEDFFKNHTKLFQQNIVFRFRDPSQFTFISLSNHLQLLNGNRNIGKPGLEYIMPHNRGKNYVNRKLKRCEDNPNTIFLCVQSLEMGSDEDQQKIFGWLDNILQL